jgi:choice-of-anchor B domain-containing protein
MMKEVKVSNGLRYILVVLYALILITNIFGQTDGVLIYNWTDPENIEPGGGQRRYNDCWGFEMNGREYGVIGSTMGTHIIDISQADTAIESTFIRGKFSSRSVVHRDYHDYGGYLYGVCDQGASSLQVIDIQGLPNSAFLAHEDTVNIMRAHNLFIDSAAMKMYTCGVRLPNGARVPIQVWSLDNPRQPSLIRNVFTIDGVDIDYVHDMYARNDTVFMNAGRQGLVIANFEDTESPELLGVLSNYPDAGYNHSGWWNERGDTYYMADETHGKDIKIVDVSNIESPVVTRLIEAESDPEGSIPHNLIVKDDMLFVSYYFDGLQIFDVTSEENACWAYSYRTSQIDPVPGGFAGAWGVYPFLPSGRILVSDMQNGLFVVELPELSPSDTTGQEGTLPCQPDPKFAHVQFIHNSPSPLVDVYIDGHKVMDSLAFREATEFIEIIVDHPVVVGFAPSPSQDSSTIIFRDTLNLEEDQNHIIMAQGAIGNNMRPLQLKVLESVILENNNPQIFRFNAVHGALDLSSIDLSDHQTAQNFFAQLEFNQSTGFIEVFADQYLLDLMTSGITLRTYEANLEMLGATTAIVFASGYLDSASGPSLGLFLAFPDGTVLELPEAFFTNVQFLQNSPSVPLDFYLNGRRIVENIKYQEGTPPLELRAEHLQWLEIKPSGSSDVVFEDSIMLHSDENYLMAVQGIPEDINTPIGLRIINNYRFESSESGRVDFAFLHGATTLDVLDLYFEGGPVASNIAFNNFVSFSTVSPATYVLSINEPSNPDYYGQYALDLSDKSGEALTVFATTFLETDPDGFNLWALEADGTTYELVGLTHVNERIDLDFQVGPIPAKDILWVQFSQNVDIEHVELLNVNGEVIKAFEGFAGPEIYSSIKLDVGNVPVGANFLRIISNGKAFNIKVPVMR